MGQTFDIIRDTALFGIFTCLTFPIVYTDIKKRIIPDLLSLGGGVLMIIATGFLTPRALPGALAAASAAAAVFALIRRFTGGLGFGDVKLAVLIGAFTGLYGLPVAFLVAALAGIGFFGYAALTRRRASGATIPFAPFMVAGAYAAFFARLSGLETFLYGTAR